MVFQGWHTKVTLTHAFEVLFARVLVGWGMLRIAIELLGCEINRKLVMSGQRSGIASTSRAATLACVIIFSCSV